MTTAPVEAAWNALQDGDLDLARARFDALIARSPASVDGWLGLAHVARAEADWRAVVDALEAVTAHVRDREVVRDAALCRGFLLDRRLGDLMGARHQYESALLVAPDLVWPYLALAELDVRGGIWNRALAHATHGLEGAGPFESERPWLLLCRAIGRRRSSLSIGAVSTFFRQLGGEGTSDGTSDLALAVRALPSLADVLPERPLDDTAAVARLIRDRMPQPAFPVPR